MQLQTFRSAKVATGLGDRERAEAYGGPTRPALPALPLMYGSPQLRVAQDPPLCTSESEFAERTSETCPAPIKVGLQCTTGHWVWQTTQGPVRDQTWSPGLEASQRLHSNKN